jgi:hypothetical protein
MLYTMFITYLDVFVDRTDSKYTWYDCSVNSLCRYDTRLLQLAALWSLLIASSSRFILLLPFHVFSLYFSNGLVVHTEESEAVLERILFSFLPIWALRMRSGVNNLPSQAKGTRSPRLGSFGVLPSPFRLVSHQSNCLYTVIYSITILQQHVFALRLFSTYFPND